MSATTTPAARGRRPVRMPRPVAVAIGASLPIGALWAVVHNPEHTWILAAVLPVTPVVMAVAEGVLAAVEDGRKVLLGTFTVLAALALLIRGVW